MENERGLTVRASFMVIGALAAAMVTEIDGGSADLWLWLNHQLRVGDGKHTGFESLQDLKQRPNPETHREIDLQRERERERERERVWCVWAVIWGIKKWRERERKKCDLATE